MFKVADTHTPQSNPWYYDDFNGREIQIGLRFIF